MRKKSKFYIVLGGTIIILGILVISLVSLFMVRGEYKATKIEEYEDMKEEFKNYAYGGLKIFPDKIPDNIITASYMSEGIKKGLDPKCQIYLSIQYSSDNFKKEIERLSNIKETLDKNKLEHNISYDKNNFIYPAYVTIFESNGVFEYALVNSENNEVTYIFIQNTKKESVKFSDKYLPHNFMKYMNSRNSSNEYNMYSFSSKEIES